MTAKRLMLVSILLSGIGIGLLLLNSPKPQSLEASQAAAVFKRVLVSNQNIEAGDVYSATMFRWQAVPQNELDDYLT